MCFPPGEDSTGGPGNGSCAYEGGDGEEEHGGEGRELHFEVSRGKGMSLVVEGREVKRLVWL